MEHTQSMTTARRLTLGFSVMVLLVLALGAASWYGVQRLGTTIADTFTNDLKPIDQLAEVTRATLRDRILVAGMVDDPSAENLRKSGAEVEANAKIFADGWAVLKAVDFDREEAAMRDKFGLAADVYYARGIRPAVDALKAGKADLARELQRTQISALALSLAEHQKALEDTLVKSAEDNAAEAAALARRIEMLALAIVVLAVATGTLIGVLLTRSIVRQLGAEPAELAQVADRIAQGDLTHVDETAATAGSVMASMQAMQRALVKLVSEVRSGVDSVSTASAQIAAGNQDLSSRTESQASNLQQTAASMEQMTSSVRTNADSAREADKLARDASEVAARGGSAVGDVVATMSAIQAASHKIEEIISVIDGIAFQTNILALNAAVEAARAGEQGRGFAVVAGEVRNLAQRSAQAAKEIKSLISDSVTKINDGSSRVQAAGQTIGEVVEQVNRVSRLIGEITAATMEQSNGIVQVNDAVTQLDQMTQQNAALVEESAAAATSLRDQADKLAQSVAVFRLSQGEALEAIATARRSSRAAVPPAAARPAKAARPLKPQAAAKPAARAAQPAPSAPAAPGPAARSDAGDEWKEF